MSAVHSHVRKASVAGMFYPSHSVSLHDVVSGYLSQAGTCPFRGEVWSVMSPHAGYVYSAGIGASSFQALSGCDFDTVVIIGHDFGLHARGISAIFSDYDVYETPLGAVEVDTSLQSALMSRLGNCVVDSVHASEHTIEVQLPFLQSLGKSFKILPILFGEVKAVHCRQLTDALLSCAGSRRIVVFASSDMSHYPPYELSREIDDETLSLICAGDLGRLCRRATGQETVGTSPAARRFKLDTPLCATGGVGVAMLWAEAHGVDTVRVLAKGNSGDSSQGAKDRVVGYGSVVFMRCGSGEAYHVDMGAETGASDGEFQVSPKAQKALLSLVRERIAARASGASKRIPMPAGMAELSTPAAAFVTLKKRGKLRGCIGTTEAHESLWSTVSYFAEAAAFTDPRFAPVRRDEVEDLSIEISVLSPLSRCSTEEIVPFRDGVMIRSGLRSGLFLPQVWEQLPEFDEFMGYLCSEKAGLAADAWKDSSSCELYRFTVVSFES